MKSAQIITRRSTLFRPRAASFLLRHNFETPAGTYCYDNFETHPLGDAVGLALPGSPGLEWNSDQWYIAERSGMKELCPKVGVGYSNIWVSGGNLADVQIGIHANRGQGAGAGGIPRIDWRGGEVGGAYTFYYCVFNTGYSLEYWNGTSSEAIAAGSGGDTGFGIRHYGIRHVGDTVEILRDQAVIATHITTKKSAPGTFGVADHSESSSGAMKITSFGAGVPSSQFPAEGPGGTSIPLLGSNAPVFARDAYRGFGAHWADAGESDVIVSVDYHTSTKPYHLDGYCLGRYDVVAAKYVYLYIYAEPLVPEYRAQLLTQSGLKIQTLISHTPGTTRKMKIRIVGNTYTAYLDDVEILSYTDPEALSTGTHSYIAIGYRDRPPDGIGDDGEGYMDNWLVEAA